MNPIIIPCATEEEWLKVRSDPRYLGASDIPTLFGLGFLSPLELYAQKRGGKLSTKETERMTAGKFLEDGNAKWYAHATGRGVFTPQDFYNCDAYAVIVRHPTLPLQATPDRLITRKPAPTSDHLPDDDSGWGVLQLKNADARMLDEWDGDEPPIRVQCQVQAEMLCTGLTWGAIGAVIGGNTRRDADVDAHPEFQRTLADLAIRFLADVAAGKPPQAEGTDDDVAAVKALWPREIPGTQVELKRPELVFDLIALQARYSADDKAIKALKAEILKDLGDAEEGMIGGARAVYAREEGKDQIVQQARKRQRILRIDSDLKPKKNASEHASTPILP